MAIITPAAVAANAENTTPRVFERPVEVPKVEEKEEVVQREFTPRVKKEYKPRPYGNSSCYDLCGVDGCGNKACSNYHTPYRNS